MLRLAEYIWHDGASPTQQLRSKGRVVNLPEKAALSPDALPVWSYDGSSTYQSEGVNSDLVLQPVRVLPDPVRGGGNLLVLCEVLTPDGDPHPTNSRAHLRKVLDAGAAEQDPWFGFEQEYTLFDTTSPMGWPDEGFPAPQGPYYCGVGAQEVSGRPLVEAHLKACMDAGIMLYGINAEVMPGQWEFQVGYRGVPDEQGDPLTVCDHLWIARYLLHRLGEDYDVNVSLSNKPIPGDWNGAGNHTNFSTKDMRDSSKGLGVIEDAIKRLEAKHADHIAEYGAGLDERLTGDHETSHIGEFKHGVADRTASIRIPRQVEEQGGGYLEDRRPGANSDPYIVAAKILSTVLGIGE